MYALSLIKEFVIHISKVLFRNEDNKHFGNFKKDILDRKIRESDLTAVLNYYDSLLSNENLISLKSPGAGSKKSKRKPTISEYARSTSVGKKRGYLLYGIVYHYKPELIIELGTSLGISAMYMSSANPLARVITVEGNLQIAENAASNFRKYGYNNIIVINRLFDDVINDLIKEVNANTMVFIDGNHGFDATLRYFNAFSEAFLVVIDDIRWSEEMMRAWKQICISAKHATIIDLFDIGIILKGGTGNKYALLP